MAKSWKDYLLRSGLPLENDVKNFLDSRGCISAFEFSYLRKNEQNVEKEFSYDIDASWIDVGGNDFIDFMVECKYRHETTKWIFTPQKYGGPEEIDPNSFMHPCDHFVPIEFPCKYSFPENLAPLCSKGTEITTSGDNEKSINQAVSQLSYAFASKILDAIKTQVNSYLDDDYIFYHIPVIVTTATLHRLKETVNIDSIKTASCMGEISTEHNCLVLKNTASEHLIEYNRAIFEEYLKKQSKGELIKKLCTFTDDLNHLFSVLASFYCPQVFVIAHFSSLSNGLEHLLDYVERIRNPPQDLVEKLIDKERKQEKIRKDMKARFNS